MDRAVFLVTDALGSSPAVALGAAVVWGVLSVLLSPCHLGTIPLVVGMVGGASGGVLPRGRAAALSFSFAGGMLVAVAILAVLVSTVGFAVAGLGSVTNYVVAAVFLAAGLHLTGMVDIPMPSLSPRTGGRTGMGAAAAMGLVFGLGLSPCTFAFLAPILGMTIQGSAAGPLAGFALLLAFGVGHCGVIGLAGSSTAVVQRYLGWNQQSKALDVLKTVCGVLVLLAAGVLIYSA